MWELPRVREVHGFTRTVCGCELCSVFCRHVPGHLDPADLEALCPPGHDLHAWAEEHLRARTDRPVPTLVPARQANGHCHWLYEGRCAVHDRSPFGCAFFDVHLTDAEAERRARASRQARADDVKAKGPYWRIWSHLCAKGLLSQPADRDALKADVRRLQRQRQRVLATDPEAVVRSLDGPAGNAVARATHSGR